MLPGMDGFEVARTLRQESNIPILMLTARDDEIDRVVGLEVGADDYMTKPFSMRELLARVKAMLRRVRLIREEMSVKPQDSTPDARPGFGNLEWIPSATWSNWKARSWNSTPRNMSCSSTSCSIPGKAISRDTLIQEIWGWDFSGDSRTVDVHVRWLRQKIEQDPSNPTRLVTLRGAGYRFES